MGYHLKIPIPQVQTRISDFSAVPSKTHTPALRLQDRGLRFYNSQFGRWMSRDPIEELGGINLLCFVFNNPINAVDSYGQSPAVVYTVLALTGAGSILLYVWADGTFRWVRDIWAQRTLAALPDGPPKLFWSNARDGALTGMTSSQLRLEIDSNNQTQWGNIIDAVESTTTYINARDQIVATVVNSAASSGNGVVPILFTTSDPKAYFSLRAVNVFYSYDFAVTPCVVDVDINDFYDFHNQHVWAKMMTNGELVPFAIKIHMPNPYP